MDRYSRCSSFFTMKRNGFTNPLHSLQALSIITVFLQAVVYYVIMIPGLTRVRLIAHLVLYSIALVFTIYFGFLTIHSDPTDNLAESM
jgi:hypothetical protein